MNSWISKSMLLMGSVVALSIPFASEARDNGVDKCIQQVVDQVVPANHPVRIVKKDQDGSTSQLTGATRVFVTARGEATGKIYGRATCVLNPRGTLIAVRLKETTPERLADNR